MTVSECCLIDEIAADNFSLKIVLYFCLGNGQFHEPTVCQLYRYTLVPHAVNGQQGAVAPWQHTGIIIKLEDAALAWSTRWLQPAEIRTMSHGDVHVALLLQFFNV